VEKAFYRGGASHPLCHADENAWKRPVGRAWEKVGSEGRLDRRYAVRSVLLRRFASLVILVSLSWLGSAGAQDGRFPPRIQTKVQKSLLHQLTGAGFNASFVQALLHDQRWELSLVVLEKNLVYRESKANYQHVLDAYSTSLAKDFLQKNCSFLEKTEKEFGVEKEIIVAILLIESSLGRHAEKHRVFNTLSGLSQATHPDVFPLAFDYLRQSYPDVTESYLKERAKKKSRWAFQELVAFLRIGIREDLDILDVRGSWAGAFGLPQFVPTSYLTYAVDGDGDRRVHLHNRHDAMASVANYLKVHGWKPGLAPEEMKRILFRYNRSRLYGETVLESARKLANHPTCSQRSPMRNLGKWG
jgi:membrane-bound lytic murein transglycosylase B